MNFKLFTISLATISTLGIFTTSVPVQAATHNINEREVNDQVARLTVGLNSQDILLLSGKLGPQNGKLDGSDMFQLSIKEKGKVRFVLSKQDKKQNSQNSIRLWTDRNGDRRITNETRLFSKPTFQDTVIDLAPGTYIVQITQSKKVPVAKGYTAVIHRAK